MIDQQQQGTHERIPKELRSVVNKLEISKSNYSLDYHLIRVHDCTREMVSKIRLDSVLSCLC